MIEGKVLEVTGKSLSENGINCCSLLSLRDSNEQQFHRKCTESALSSITKCLNRLHNMSNCLMTIKNSLIKKFYVAITTVKMVRFSSTHQAKLNKISLLIYCWQGLEERIILHSLLLLLALLQL